MSRSTAAVLMLTCLGWGCGKSSESPMQAATTSKYHPGEEYSFEGRPADDQPRFLVLKVDAHPKLGNIVHISISGVRIKNAQAPKGIFDHVQHFPMAEPALDKSRAKLLKSGSIVPDFQSAYQEWRKPFDQGKAGIWSAPLAECLQAMEQSINR
jgi:hypothetical protein